MTTTGRSAGGLGLEADVFDLMTRWIERYRRAAEERYRRLDGVLAAMDASDPEQKGTTP
jgi:hypothetical protein